VLFWLFLRNAESITMAAPHTVTGVVSDDMCKQEHMMPGHSDADCTRACVKSGSRYALVADARCVQLALSAKK
jgi:hypothetical protein